VEHVGIREEDPRALAQLRAQRRRRVAIVGASMELEGASERVVLDVGSIGIGTLEAPQRPELVLREGLRRKR